MAVGHTFANTTFDWGFAAVASITSGSLAFVAGETGVATLVAVAVLAIVLLATAKVWKTGPLAVAAPRVDHAARERVEV